MKRINRVFDFTLEQLYNADGIDGMNDLAQQAYQNEDGESAGILSELEFYPVGVNEEQGLIRIQVIAAVVPIK